MVAYGPGGAQQRRRVSTRASGYIGAMGRRMWLRLSCLLLVLSVSACSSASQQEEINSDRLSSTAVDGSELGGLIVNGRAGAIFARAHARELQENADRVRLSVADARTPDHQRLEKLAEQVSSALGDVVAHPDDRAVARRAQRTLKALSSQIEDASS